MEFDLSKENIQPLRGGRNASQLEVALQAENNTELQRELLIQKEEYENAIRNYAGDDPLDCWYQYILWVEQSYPKHGHEGNLVVLLEDCLGKFENDSRYVNDIRFCKLWIKYNDMQQNPTELFQMMHARGLCKGCADLYRAWAYYHEAAGDFRSADMVFQMGLRELAQPYEELSIAHQNMIFAAGQQVISGVNEQRLAEQRKALTKLHSYKSGKVGRVRIPSSNEAGVVSSTGQSFSRSNIAIPIYEGADISLSQAQAVGPDSILNVARRQDAPKENTIKPGTWSGAALEWKNPTRKAPSFAVYEDVGEMEKNDNFQLPTTCYPTTHEDYSQWKCALCYAEPDDPSRIPMYPKAKVYGTNETEFSIEELRALRYHTPTGSRLNISHVETEQAIQSILGEDNIKEEVPQQATVHEVEQPDQEDEVEFVSITHLPPQANRLSFQKQHALPATLSMSTARGSFVHQASFNASKSKSPRNQRNRVESNIPQFSPQATQNFQKLVSPPVVVFNDNFVQHGTPNAFVSSHVTSSPGSSRVFGQSLLQDQLTGFGASPYSQNKNTTNQNDMNDFQDVLWNSPSSDNESVAIPKSNVSKFSIFESSTVEQLQPKGSAMKTLPFKILSNEELAETGSRGGHDIAAAAQPGDGAKRITIFEDDSSSSSPENDLQLSTEFDLESSCNTQVFNFNLNAMKVSTPQSKQSSEHFSPNDRDAKKQLFGSAQKRFSTIFEETESCGGSSSFKSNTNQSKRENSTQQQIPEEGSGYHFNLAQNLKANAHLRTSLLELMDCESGQSSPVTEMPIMPLERAPSDPFKPALLASLLQRVGFPGRHTDGYVKIQSTPKMTLRKEVTYIGGDAYCVDKILGKGNYGQVFKATDARCNRTVALKMQKPPNRWEFYICRELQARLAHHPLRECFMHVERGYFNDQASVFVSEFSPGGSLLDVANNYRQKIGQTLKQVMCVYFCIEMLKIVSAMHQAKIIHADIKPDNFLVYVVADGGLHLQLIDFGCSIDMTFFPPGTSFKRRVTTKDFICPEMQEGRLWNYHTDLFCVAATAHVLLFDKYMQLQKKGETWSITQRFTRYMKLDLWNMFFSTLLNQQKGPADPEKLISFLTDHLQFYGDEVNMEMRKLVNMLNNR